MPYAIFYSFLLRFIGFISSVGLIGFNDKNKFIEPIKPMEQIKLYRTT